MSYAEHNWNIEEADEYIRWNTLDNDDWFDGEEPFKVACLNNAEETLLDLFALVLKDDEHPLIEIPVEAVYYFSATLAFRHNDTNKLAQQGISSFAIRGLSTTFKDWSRETLVEMIPHVFTALLDIVSQTAVV
ncbi:hypothetical protein JCM19037_1565 [Geomicrobium sp. JCM 19037]|uniref:hypothetical protein n=1 Tax=Geomicrobium sp. JCM 19037 TaxID=1460634 RepID=UPI00045F1E4E|nr:hypothetical protein [Geomicrobium sp. JCM 19037]GAK03258.1 hypothetical protein JCM19037_1565 [Geomicrobium sp. JCM 19037]